MARRDHGSSYIGVCVCIITRAKDASMAMFKDFGTAMNATYV